MKSRFSTVHPATWMVAGCSALIVALSPIPLLTQAVFLAFLLAVFAVAGLGRRYLRFAIIGMFPVAAMAFIVQAISYQHNSVVWWEFAPLTWMRFALGPDGLLHGVRLALQILLLGSAFALISVPNSPEQLRVALHRWHVPSRAIYLLVAAINAPVLLSRTMRTVREAQRMRGLSDRSLMQNFRLVVQATGALVNLVLLENEGRTRSLEQRGIDAGQRSLLRSYPDDSVQKLLRLVMPLIGITVAALSMWWRIHA